MRLGNSQVERLESQGGGGPNLELFVDDSLLGRQHVHNSLHQQPVRSLEAVHTLAQGLLSLSAHLRGVQTISLDTAFCGSLASTI